MFEFTKLCREFDTLTPLERSAMLTKKSAVILAKLTQLSIPGVDPVNTLAGFILGSVVADGHISEREYLLIYPALLKVFGDEFDFESVKDSFRKDRDGRAAVRLYTQEMLALLALADEGLREDMIMLCLCVVSMDGRITLREQRYIHQLCAA